MSHTGCYFRGMNRTPSAKSRRRQPVSSPALTWSHLGQLHRVTVGPEANFEREVTPGRWEGFQPNPMGAEFVAAAVMIDARRWRSYLEYLPADEARWVNAFGSHRMLALAALRECPALKEDFMNLPVLALLVAAHPLLRDTTTPAWAELTTVFERNGLFGLLEWLGLPATGACLEFLAEAQRDTALCQLEPMRGRLWQLHEAGVVRSRTGHSWSQALAA